MTRLTPAQQKKQELYRDARFTDTYDQIWQSVGKCVFCDLRDKYIFFEENGIVMTVSLYAYIDGHCMIVPRRHIRSIKELTQIEWDTIRKCTYLAKKLIKDVHKTKGMQLVQKDGAEAQSTVDQHLHFHCIPFDAPDLCEWNYRKLAYTPIENTGLYRHARKKIAQADIKFEQKYKQLGALQIVCDLIMVNTKHEVLFQVRTDGLRFKPDSMSLPGGHVEDFNVPLETELAREVSEETGYQLNSTSLKLHASRISNLLAPKKQKSLNASYFWPKTFLWNTYITTGLDPNMSLTPGDDCTELVWIPLKEIKNHPKLSLTMQKTFEGLQL